MYGTAYLKFKLCIYVNHCTCTSLGGPLLLWQMSGQFFPPLLQLCLLVIVMSVTNIINVHFLMITKSNNSMVHTNTSSLNYNYYYYYFFRWS